MVIQMGIIIGVFAYAGHYLDLKFDSSKILDNDSIISGSFWSHLPND